MKALLLFISFFPLFLSAQHNNNKWGISIGANYWLEKNNIDNVRGYAPYQIKNHLNWQLGANYQWTLRNKRRHIIAELGLGKHTLSINSIFKATDLGHNLPAIININSLHKRQFTYASVRFAYDWKINTNISLSTFGGAGLLYFVNDAIASDRYSFAPTDSATNTLLSRKFTILAGNRPYSRGLPFQPYIIAGINFNYNLPKINKQVVLGLSFETSSRNQSKDFISYSFYDNLENMAGAFNYNNALKRISLRCEFKF